MKEVGVLFVLVLECYSCSVIFLSYVTCYNFIFKVVTFFYRANYFAVDVFYVFYDSNILYLISSLLKLLFLSAS
jgi:hypothetical protein